MSSISTNLEPELSQSTTRDFHQGGRAKQDFSTWRSLHGKLSSIVQTPGKDLNPHLDQTTEELLDDSTNPKSQPTCSSNAKEMISRVDQSEKGSNESDLSQELEGLGGSSVEANSKWELQLKNLGGLAHILKRIQEMSLSEGLKQFGLDPKEWRLQRLARDVYRVEHVRDEGFSFVGKVQGTVLKPLKWKSLTLEAI